MSGLRLYEAGFGPLVSVVPPGAKLHESSRIKPAELGKVPGIFRDGTWGGYPFTKHKPSKAEIKTWDSQGANIGLLGDHFPGLDIDVDEPVLAEAIERMAEEILGETAVRLSREPRRMLVYRTDKPFGRIALIVTYKGVSHLVEFLGQGRQYLVYGTHPTGVPYAWSGQDLWDFEPSDIPEISGEIAMDFLLHLMAELEGVECECELVGSAKEKNTEERPQDSLLAPSTDVLVALVRALPNPPEWDRSMYVEVACAIKAAGAADDEAAREAFMSWASLHDTHDHEHDEKTWASLSGPYRVGWSWLQERAAELTDYQPAVDEFDAVDAPEDDVTIAAQGGSSAPENDEEVVRMLLPDLREALRYVPNMKRWYQWQGHVWAQDNTMGHESMVRGLLGPLATYWRQRGAAAPNKEQAGVWKKAASKYQNSEGISAVVRLAQARLAVEPASFDPDPMVLNTPESVIDLETGDEIERDSTLMFTRSTSVAPKRGPHPFWDQFLKDLAGGDKSLVAYLQIVCGYILTGDISEKTLWFIWGSNSDTGKSTFIRVLTRLLGSYADTVDASVFVGSTNRIPAELARLPGVRLVAATEPKSGHSWDEKRIKAITGGDAIECRFLYGQPFTYDPQFKILIIGNHEPEIENVDDAMLRRVHIIPFNKKVPRDKQIENLAAKLVDREGPAILQWMIDGALRWQVEGLKTPTVVRLRTNEYADEENLLGQWIETECELGDEHSSTTTALYSAWSMWCRERGEEPGGSKQMARKLYGLGFKRAQVGDRRLRGCRGIRLRPRVEMGTEEDFG